MILLEEDGERVLVIGDLHIGYDEAIRRSGILLPNVTLKNTERDLQQILDKVGKIDKVILLGDIKHSFGLMGLEWKGILAFLDRLFEYCKTIVIVKGNHDASLEYIADKRNIVVMNFYLWKKYAFLHGDRDFQEIYDSTIACWIVGHAHPAVWLRDGAKREKYKCFLVGTYKRKKVIVMPSFFTGNEGSDPRENDLELAWPLDFGKSQVIIVGDALETFDFGVLNKLPY